MGIGFYQKKKVKGRSAGYHQYTREDMKRVDWCMRNKISISVTPHWKGALHEWKINIRINNNTHVDPKVYEASDAYKKMYEYYKYYYDKNRK